METDAEMIQEVSQQCLVCTHPDRDDLEEQIASGVLLKSTLAKELDINTEDVFIHMKEHIIARTERQMAEKVVERKDLQKVQSKRDILLTNMGRLNDRLEEFLDEEEGMSASTTSQIVKMMTEVRHHVETMAALEGELKQEREITLIQFNQLKAFVIRDLCPNCQKKMVESPLTIEAASIP